MNGNFHSLDAAYRPNYATNRMNDSEKDTFTQDEICVTEDRMIYTMNNEHYS